MSAEPTKVNSMNRGPDEREAGEEENQPAVPPWEEIRLDR